jgi:hypothetical protein
MSCANRNRFSWIIPLMAFAFGVFGIAAGVAPAAAESADKPKVAVLGLEVTDKGAGVDAATTQFAKTLSDAMRLRPGQGSGPYWLAQNSAREFIDLKAIAGCDDEGKDTKEARDKYRECVARIGVDLKTDYLVYGKVERDKSSYLVTVYLLRVSTKQIEQKIPESVPFDQSSGADAVTWGKNIYGRLVGAATQGSIVVRSSAQRGTVLINNRPRGSLVAGELKIANLPEGSYEVAVDTEGHPRYKQTITVVGGEEATVLTKWEDKVVPPGNGNGSGNGDGHLESREGLVSRDGGDGKGLWKGMFFGGLAVAAGGGGFWAYSWNKIDGAKPTLDSSHCGDPVLDEATSSACDYRRNTGIGMGIVGVGGAMAAVGFYFAYVRESNPTERSASHRKFRDRVVVTPVVSTDAAGAIVRFDF